jgi:tetratricopeptide (TPR) repeat protein
VDQAEPIADIAQLVPELRVSPPELPAAPSLDAGEARFRLFDAVCSYLTESARTRSMLLVIDDLHWADEPSLLLLRFLAPRLREAKLLLLATYRDVEVRRDHPLRDILPSLRREPHCERIHLKGLEREAIRRFVEVAIGRRPDAELVEALQEVTEGNPFFLSETIELLAESGALDADSAQRERTLPDGLRDVVGRRLDRLSEACNRLLRRASVIGMDLALGVLERFGDLATEQLLERLDEAVASGLVERVGAGAGRYRFRHALIRQALYEELSTSERIRLHRELAEQLADLYSSNPEPFLDTLAHHFYQAAPGGDVDRAVDYSERAARAALETLAYEQATVHYERALEALELRAERDELRRCELLLELGYTLELTGERERMRETYARAAQFARALARPDLLARAALGFAGRTERGVPDVRSREILQEALEALGQGHDALRATLLCYLLGTPPYRDPIETRIELCSQAAELAHRSGDPDALLEALAARAWVLLGPDHVEERLRIADEAFAISEQRGGGARRILPIEMRIRSLLALGDLASADREIVRYCELAQRLRWPAFQFLGESYGAGRALADGRFDDAEAHCRRGFELGSASQHPATGGFLFWYRFWLERERGVPVLQHLAEQVDVGPVTDFESPSLRAWLTALGAFANAEQGDEDETRRALDRLPTQALLALPRDEHWITTMALLADATAQVRDEERAALLYDLLLPYAEQNLAHDLMRSYLGSTHHYLARLAGALDRFDQAEAHYEAALGFNRQLGAAPLLARSQAAWGELLRERDRATDRQRTRELLEQAYTTAVQLGMPGLARRVEEID